MELARLIEALADPAAYPEAVEKVEVRQTHISAVFLAGRHAYKIKKPVNLGFLDFRTLEDRRRYCEAEVRLNRRLAPAVYQGVVPITRTEQGFRVARSGDRATTGGPGEVIEWAVQMERLPEEATFRSHLLRGDLDPAWVEALARRVAAFHAGAEGGAHVSAFGLFDVVARNARENFEQAAAHVGTALSRPVFERLRARTEEALARLRPLIEGRAARGVPRDTHGDLHLDHVYLFPGRQPPDDLVVIDCIEFNERFRFADPVADMAFLAMDLLFHGRRDLARSFTDAYFRASGDDEGRALVPFYTAYRAAVRGKVGAFKWAEREVPRPERERALAEARAHWLLALGELEPVDRRPCLVLVGGLPGAGKSTLARALAGHANLHVLRTDVIRKELAGRDAGAPAAGAIYTPEWTERTYAECLRRAEEGLFQGERVLVDATFREDGRRQTFLEAAARWGVPAVCLLCRADPEVARARIQARRNDASDADWSVYLELVKSWEKPGPRTRRLVRDVATGGSPEQALAQALAILRELALYGD
jgi:aminoglycoside phosphotransferase family enzyme/predicted kinase